MKNFFKSAAFRSLCLLLGISLAAGGLLAVCNDLLYVSDAERLDRTLSKIYGKPVTTTEVALSDELKRNAYGNVDTVRLTADGNLLIKTTGVGGYNGGTVTVWTVLNCDLEPDPKLNGVEKVVYESNAGQSFISKTTGLYERFPLYNDRLKEGTLFTADPTADGIFLLATGASFSSAAACNAVNAALTYFQNAYGSASPYEFAEYIDLKNSTATVENQAVHYVLTVRGNSPARAFTISITVENQVIGDYKIEKDGSTTEKYSQKIPEEVKSGALFVGKSREQILMLLDGGALSDASGILNTGATKSTESCVRAAAFAVLNYEKILQDGGLL